MEMKIAVTGATGFIGKRLVKKLLEKGLAVRCISRRKISFADKPKELEFFLADLNSNSLKDALKGIDAVIHLAAEISSKNIEKTFSVNVDGTKNLLASAKANKIKKFIFISSEMANFPEESFYGKTKLIGEGLVKDSKIPFVIFRPTIVFGPGDKRNFSYLIERTMHLPFSFFLGSGKNRFQPVFVDDLADAIIASLEKKEALGKTFEIGGSEAIEYKKIIEIINEEFHWKKPVFSIPKKPLMALASVLEKIPLFSRAGMFEVSKKRVGLLSKDRPVDISLAKKILGFKPIAFREALIKTMKEENWV